MPRPDNDPPLSKPMFQALSLAWELGYTIAIPLVVLALLGRMIDKWLGSSPWVLLVGVLLSIFLSTWLVYRKTKLIVSAQDTVNNTNTKTDVEDKTKGMKL